MTQSFRTEQDSMGTVQVPEDALYQAQTQRAADNFHLSHHLMPEDFIQALALIKQAAAATNAQLGLLEKDIAVAISDAAQEIIEGQHLSHFPVGVFQTGSGTSSNMNMNEVLATLASRSSGKTVSPNDHVNMGQSSNDVVPTAIQVSIILSVEQQLLPALHHLSEIIGAKQQTLTSVIKTGRTHLMDAMPISFAQELSGWQHQINHAAQAIRQQLPAIKALAQGGTAVGTGINAHPQFAGKFASQLSQVTGTDFTTSDNYFFNLSSQDTTVALSGQLKTTAVAMMKIANDLRWMNSGPLAGLGKLNYRRCNPVLPSCPEKSTR